LLGVGTDFRPHTADETAEVLRAHHLSHGQYMLALGTLEPRKNLQLALTAFERLPTALQVRCPLVLVGMVGWNNDVLALKLAPLIHKGVVRQLGYLPHQELVKVVAGARCMVYPSVYEGFGLPPLESMACGVPVITSNASSLPEVVADAGLLVSPEDDEGLSMAMQALLEDLDLHARLAQAGLARSVAFTWAECARQTREVYGFAMSDAGV
jgi:glycosyltransferase involved in cell wall biosynthesis